eukprot:49471-Eustigmatos_ZCMA.PRE.1
MVCGVTDAWSDTQSPCSCVHVPVQVRVWLPQIAQDAGPSADLGIGVASAIPLSSLRGGGINFSSRCLHADCHNGRRFM